MAPSRPVPSGARVGFADLSRGDRATLALSKITRRNPPAAGRRTSVILRQVVRCAEVGPATGRAQATAGGARSSISVRCTSGACAVDNRDSAGSGVGGILAARARREQGGRRGVTAQGA